MKSPEITESKKLKFSYPFGIGAFLMNSCYRTRNKNKEKSIIDYNQRRKKRSNNSNRNKTLDIQNLCKNYVKEQSTEPCKVIIFVIIYSFIINYLFLFHFKE